MTNWLTISQCATLVDFTGSLLIVISVLRTLWGYILRNGSSIAIDALRFSLAADLVTALSFKSGAGIIRTLTITTWDQFLTVLAIISLRFLLSQALKRIRQQRTQPNSKID